jgi:hypothetical protein
MSKRKCAYCGDYFDRESMEIRGLSAFCSNAHFLASINTAKPKQKKPKQSNPHNDLSAVRDKILALDNYRCRYCGKASNNLAVHHIYYRSEAKNEPWLNQQHNLITLCNYPCHLDIIHGNKKLYQPLCLQIVWLRTFNNDRYTTIHKLERLTDDIR